MGNEIKAAVSTRDEQDKRKICVSCMTDYAYYFCSHNLMDATYSTILSILHILNPLTSWQTYRVKSAESLTSSISNKTGNILGHTDERSFRQGFIQGSKNVSLSPFLCSTATILTPTPGRLLLPNPPKAAYSCKFRCIFLAQSWVGAIQFEQKSHNLLPWFARFGLVIIPWTKPSSEECADCFKPSID